jgi:hypothetical protein
MRTTLLKLLTLAAWIAIASSTNRAWAQYTTQNAIAADSGYNNLTSFGDPVTQVVASGSSYAGLSSIVVGTSDGAGCLGTTATLLEGSNTLSSNTTVSMAWRNRANVEQVGGTHPPLPSWGCAYLGSDVLQLQGVQDTPFVLQMDYVVNTVDNVANGSVCIGELIDGVWENAADPALQGTTNDKFYEGSYQSFRDSHTGALTDLLGYWGVDTQTDEAWAVLDQNGSFAVVPEPGTISLLATGGLGLAAYVWRRRRSAGKASNALRTEFAGLAVAVA